MDVFYEDLLVLFTKKYLEVLQPHTITGNEYTFNNEDKVAAISVYPERMMELLVKNSHTHESIYYLHLEIHNFHDVTSALKNCFYVLYGDKKEETVFNETLEKKVLICCSVGGTSFLMASLLSETGLINADSSGVSEVAQIEPRYDYILLAPQVRYRYPELRQEYGTKVKIIDPILFSTMDIKGMIEAISLYE